jgi:hypothetical protein
MTELATPVRSPREACRFRVRDALVYDGLCALFEFAGLWRYPARASGDLADMGFLDKLYWMYKSSRPVRHAVRGSGLEAFFERQEPPASLAAGFRIESELQVSAVGDLMNHPYVATSKQTLYPDVANSIFRADVAMANLEGVAVAQPVGLEIDMTSGPKLAIEPEALQVLLGGPTRRYDFVATACNHSLDFAETGIASTIAALRANGIAFHGINEREADAERATILERGQFRLGIVSHTFGLNAYHAPVHRPRIVNHTQLNRQVSDIDFASFEAQLRHCAEANVDFVFAQLHWGMEFEFYPRPEQRGVAHRLAELGVDAIIGHHPHVLQPVEYYRTVRDPNRIVPIYYSLGNLTTPFSLPFMCRSGIAHLRLAKGTGPDDIPRTYVRDASLEEVVQVADDRARRLSLQSYVPA